MKQTTKEFLNGEIKESEFYNTRKEDLISLKEYYKRLKEIDKMFLYLASIDIKKIKLKLDWVDSVYFQYHLDLDDNWIQIFAKDNDAICTEYDPDEDKYMPIPRKFPGIMRFSSKYKNHLKRESDLDQIQEELRKIEASARFIYEGVDVQPGSISTEFNILYYPGEQLRVSTLDDTIAVFNQNWPTEKEKVYLDDNHKSKVLNLIQLDKRYLPRSN